MKIFNATLIFAFALLYLDVVSGCLDLVKRVQWSGRNGFSSALPTRPANLVVVHHTATESCVSIAACGILLKSIQNYHMNERKWDDIGYNFLIGNDGRVYEGRGWNKKGAHAVGFNDRSIGIAFIGNFQNSVPTAKAIAAYRNLILCSVQRGYLSKTYQLKGHRQVATSGTMCPGNSLYAQVNSWTHFKP